MTVAGQAESAALKLDIFVDGEPAGQTEVLLDGTPLGTSSAGGKFWSDAIAGGRHQLQLRLAGKLVPYEFTLSDSQAAVIAVNADSAGGRAVKSIQKLDLSQLDSEGTLLGAADSAGLAPGLIQGVLTAADSEQPLRNVTVKVISGEQQTVTDRYGNFELELPPGVYQLQLEHPEYRGSRLSELRVLPKINLAVEVQLSPLPEDVFAEGGASSIEEVQVVGRYLPGNPIEIERISSSVVDSIDFTQIARFDDSMVSSALKRVVGVSLEDDRYAVVRGMKSRYQSTDFNGAILPSTDPARRDLPMDIFPAGIMQGLSLQKSATADIPSSATAGHISMRTRDVPDQAFFKASYSATHGDMHGDDMLMSGTEGDRDWLGMDDGSRELPDELELTLDKWVDIKGGDNGYGGFDEEAIAEMGRSLQHNNIRYGDAPIDSTLSFSGGNSWEIAEQRLGLIGALRYANKWSNNTKSNFRYVRAGASDGGERISLQEFSETRDTNNVIDLSAMLNLQWDINDRHQLGLNNIALRHTTNSAEIETSYRVPTGADELLGREDAERIKQEDGTRYNYQRVDWIEEELLSHQLWGSHSLALPSGGWASYLGDLDIEWQLMEAGTEYDRPNATQYTYQGSNGGSLAIHIADAGEQYNIWESMQEDNSGHRLDIELPVQDIYGTSLVLKTGLFELQRDREGAYHYYTLKGTNELPPEVRENPDPSQVFAPEYFVGSPADEGVYLSIGSIRPEQDEGFTGDAYIVEQNFDAAYALVEADILGKLKANIGVRRESFHLAAEQYVYTPEPLTDLLDEERTSPSVSLTYLFSDAWQLRAAWSETVSWPEIFEIMPRTFIDIETLERYTGNPDLEPADIENLDLRLEWYPSESESVTLALFSKNITNAIENRFDRVGNVFDYYTFDNAEQAEVYGVELDLRREFVFGRDRGHEFFVQFNYTDITSTVEVTEGSETFAREVERPLQGQPEYITNLQLGYDHVDSGQEITLVFNRKGEELAVANAGENDSRTPSNVYEQPRNDLRLIYKKNFLNGLSLSASVDNLLDEERLLEYEDYGTPYLEYASGHRFKLKASYSF